MANGLLGKTLTSNGSNVTVYSVPATAKFATVSLNAVNLGTTVAKLRMAISYSSNPSAVDYLEYGAELTASGGILERTCMVLSPNEKLIIHSDSSEVAVRVFGLEEI